jgi:hypothetical protein
MLRTKIDIDRDVLMAAVFIMLLFIGLLLALTLYQQYQLNTAQDEINSNQAEIAKQQTSLAKLEERDRINSYQTAYRFCTRGDIDRAVLHWFASASGKPNAATRAYLRRLERKDGAPILDCKPNVTGDPATYMSPRRQREFVRRWRDHELTPVEIGICRIQIGEIANPGSCLK